MPAYWINSYRSISDADRVAVYAELAGHVMAAHGGRFLARGMPEAVFEAAEHERTVLIEFPTVGAAIAAYESPGYQEALRALGDGAVRDIRIVDGV